MTDPYPQNPHDSIDFLSSRAVNAENERLKAEVRRLQDMVKALQKELAKHE